MFSKDGAAVRGKDANSKLAAAFFERKKMAEQIITLSDGTEISEATVKSLLKQAGEQTKPYQFKGGDVAVCQNNQNAKRIICSTPFNIPAGCIFSIELNGEIANTIGQKDFEHFDYVKIGELKDFIK